MRLTLQEYFFKVLDAVRERATCNRGKSGCIIVKSNRIVATGYVGAPTGAPHCDEVGHEFELHMLTSITDTNMKVDQDFFERVARPHCIRSVHAELNAILQAARYGPPIDGADLYCTMFPCYNCAKAIINAGIKNVYAAHEHRTSERSKKLFDCAGVKWSVLDEKPIDYKS